MGTTHTGGAQYCSNMIGNLSNGYSYQRWSNGTGTGCMTPYGVDANFKANWSNSSDFLARVGLGWNATKTFDQLGTIASDFAYTKTGSGGGFSYIGIYGWSESPLVEFYIVEDWYGTSAPTGGG
ncbi:MAG TPA: glycoside hydrolase family 11 protein, partial [Polyangiaceae bacterium]